MAYLLSPIGNGWQFFGGATANSAPNIPLAAGLLYFYKAGTSTPVTTYTNPTGSSTNPFPIVLNPDGRPPNEIWVLSGFSYKAVLKDPAGNQIGSWDNLPAINDSTPGVITASSVTYTPPGAAATTVSNALDAWRPGTVRMVQDFAGTWIVYDPWGNVINTSGSTTSGLQEAINAACTGIGTRGYDLEVIGGDLSTGGASALSCTSSVVWPPMQGKKIRIGAISISWGAGIGASTGMSFNSLEMVDFEASGCQLVYHGSGIALDFHPTSGTPLDGLVAIIDSNVRFTTVGGDGTIVVRFRPGISNSTFDFAEINSGSVSIQVDTPSSMAAGFNNNTVRCMHVHGASATGISVGISSSSDNAAIFGNQWFLNIYTAGAPANAAFNTFALQDHYHIGTIGTQSGTLTDAISLSAQASKNKFFVGQIAAGVVNDTSTLKDSEGMWGSNKPRASVYLTNAQTAIASGGWVKVNLDNKLFDSGNAFDQATNHRWAPGRPGYALVSANIGWATTVAGHRLGTGIYVNGNPVNTAFVATSGTEVNQGALVSATIKLTAATDYVEIWAIQTSGVNQDINNNPTATWATFEMVDG